MRIIRHMNKMFIEYLKLKDQSRENNKEEKSNAGETSSQ